MLTSRLIVSRVSMMQAPVFSKEVYEKTLAKRFRGQRTGFRESCLEENGYRSNAFLWPESLLAMDGSQ
jgi:hypothetical protein